MQYSLGPHIHSLSSTQHQYFSRNSGQILVLRRRARVNGFYGRKTLTVAGEGESKSSEVTDTDPEGKGEQREQPANRSDGRTTWTQLRVERQTHLPASREEAWQALQALLPEKEWKETSTVFTSLEAIYRYLIAIHSLVHRVIPGYSCCRHPQNTVKRLLFVLLHPQLIETLAQIWSLLLTVHAHAAEQSFNRLARSCCQLSAWPTALWNTYHQLT